MSGTIIVYGGSLGRTRISIQYRLLRDKNQNNQLLKQLTRLDLYLIRQIVSSYVFFFSVVEQQVPSLNFKVHDEIERVGRSKIKVSLKFEAI